ncbi:MAG: DUF3293 domain-containing protein [Actinomycetia bacterium]|nr:DUF3293 domain-containing protein [Actinomycetes bacterium]MCP4959787.1 DUF3293 domain-containing protein [Actinomycetes bacterium]
MDEDIWDHYVTSEVDVGEPFNTSTATDWPVDVPLMFVITAFNPQSRVLSPDENLTLNERLKATLVQADMLHYPAVGRSADSSWAEASFALVDIDRQQACALAIEFDQKAVFEVDGTRLRIIDQLGTVRRERPLG